MTGKAAPASEDHRTRWEVLRDEARRAGPVIGALWRRGRPIGFIDRAFGLAAQRDLEQAHERAQDEASEVALAGNPRRADYIEHMAGRLIR